MTKLIALPSNVSPFGRRLGIARSLLALSTLTTLLFTPAPALFIQSASNPNGVTCNGLVKPLTLYCWGGAPAWDGTAQILSIVILLCAIAGFLPRLIAIPHWYVSASSAISFGLVEGGEHINAMLTAILIPVSLADSRLSHWHRPKPLTGSRVEYVRNSIGHIGLITIAVQMSVVYFVAAFSKMHVPQWADGTALWYWLSDPGFGMSQELFDALTPLLALLPVMAVATYSVLLLEVVGGVGILLPRLARHRLAAVLMAFHFGIALVMGLWTFGMAMAAGIILYLVRPGEQFDLRRSQIQRTPPEQIAVRDDPQPLTGATQ